MSIQAVAWVLESSKSRTFDRLVLISIANYAHRDGSGSCPSTRTISLEAGVSERQVRYSVAELVKIGELTVEYKASDYGTNIYTLAKMHLAQLAASESSDTRQAPGKHPAHTCPRSYRTVIQKNKYRAGEPRATDISEHRRKIEAKNKREEQEALVRAEVRAGAGPEVGR